jgi:hypothetical protein
MKLDELLLTKEEIEIFSKTGFFVPIHPRLLNDSENIDTTLANKVFPQAVREWYQDLKQSLESIKDIEERNWIKEGFLKEEPHIEVTCPNSQYKVQRVMPLNWEDNVSTMKNGFARSLIISRHSGGALYLSPEKEPMYIGTRFVKFSSEKFSEYSCQKSLLRETVNGCYAHVYLQHNVDHYPSALFLKNWAIFYLNEALKQISKPV